jgi:hypothetical protein
MRVKGDRWSTVGAGNRTHHDSKFILMGVRDSNRFHVLDQEPTNFQLTWTAGNLARILDGCRMDANILQKTVEESGSVDLGHDVDEVVI